jgi:hypothetical protein
VQGLGVPTSTKKLEIKIKKKKSSKTFEKNPIKIKIFFFQIS